MASSSDFVETQVVVSDSETSDCPTLHGGDGEAIAQKLFEETQLVGDLDDFGDLRAATIGHWNDTQVVEHDCGSRDDTEVVVREEEPLDAPWRSNDGENEPRCSSEEVVSEKKKKKKDSELLVTSKLFIDEDDGQRETVRKRRSFTDVRTSSLRLSGLAALKSISKAAESNPKTSFFDGTSLGLVELPTTPVNRVSLPTKAVKTHVTNEEAGTEEFTDNNCVNGEKGRARNSTTRKLFDDSVQPVEKKATRSSECKNPIVGLSYLGSQEPGSQSQANALEVVDNFLMDNIVDSSPKADNKVFFSASSPAILRVKGAQTLARSIEMKGPVERVGIYDWDDDREDESGGEFFSRRKDLFFECRECQIYSSALSKINRKDVSLTCSDSRVGLPNTLVNDKDRILATKQRKNLLYDVGPDTLVAAETMKTSNQDVGAHAVNSTRNLPRNKSRTKNISPWKVSSSNNHSDVRDGKSVKSKKGSRNVKSMKTVVSEIGVTKGRKQRKKLEDSSIAVVLNEKESPKSFVIEKKVDECNKTVKNPIVEINEFYCTPVAHRTRNSDKKRQIKGTETSADLDNFDSRPTEPGHPLLDHAVLCNISSPRTKRRKLLHSISKNSVNDTNLYHPSTSPDTLPSAIPQSSTRPRTRTFIRSVRGFLDRKVQKKRLDGVNRRSSLFDEAANNHASNTPRKHARNDLSSENNVCPAGIPSVAIEDADIERSTCLAKTPLEDINALSPALVGEKNKEMSRKRSSLPRELIRLIPTKPKPNQMVNESRKRKVMSRIEVFFSHHLDEDITKQQKKILARLAAFVAPSMSKATHFIADKFVRTRNMLEAMALGKPVVTTKWLESCGQSGCFIDVKNYILRDLKKEKEIGFSMPASLSRASEYPLLKGRRVVISSNVIPDRKTITSLVKAAQGLPTERTGRSASESVGKLPDDLLVISCEDDYLSCLPFLEQGREVFSSELILNGLVIQRLEFERHRLFTNHVKRTRSTLWLRKGGEKFVPVKKHRT